MRRESRLRIASTSAALLAVWACVPVMADPQSPVGNNTSFGTDPLLSEGAAAMLRGDWQRGIELTQAGLSVGASATDRAAALANLCGAHASLKQFDKAIAFCNESLQLEDNRWQTWQNRAACYLGIGKLDEALRDLQKGLVLNPEGDALHQTLNILREREKLRQERLQNLVDS